MSGHSKWSTIKRKKGAADAKRGKLFTKIGREIMIAVREGGADPEMNFKLRLIMDKARQANMPKDNVERSIRRGAGLEKGETLEQVVYEGYGPGGTAFIIRALTDNRNRSVADVRKVLTRAGGNLGENGCVAWMFEQKGYITIPLNGHDPDALFELALEAGADDIVIGEDTVEVYSQVADFQPVQEALVEQNIEMDIAELAMIPKTTMDLDPDKGVKVMSLVDALDELEDVERVFTNLNITDELVEQYAAEQG
ncbi:MAG: YebC/PmpR family DNA-binding transcriptional regulator [Anaerolineae bacterium]|nr:YebC/PmpR family DNA-binding transcriptional regulator [Anaerolineae bacterium]